MQCMPCMAADATRTNEPSVPIAGSSRCAWCRNMQYLWWWCVSGHSNCVCDSVRVSAKSGSWAVSEGPLQAVVMSVVSTKKTPTFSKSGPRYVSTLKMHTQRSGSSAYHLGAYHLSAAVQAQQHCEHQATHHDMQEWLPFYLTFSWSRLMCKM